MKVNPVTNLLNKIKKSFTSKAKRSNRRRRTNKKCKKSAQKGGVGFSPDVSACRIGGLPEIVPTSDCPAGTGPGSKHFAKAVYGMKGGAKRRSAKKSRSNKRKGRK